jgi:hypothetical protein
VERISAVLAAFALYGLEGALETVDSEAQGMGELGVEEEELQDLMRREISGVDLAVGFECGSAAKEAHPFEVLVASRKSFGLSPEVVVVGLKQNGCSSGALDEAADLDELPAFAVAHGGICDSVELMNGLHHHLEEFRGIGVDVKGASDIEIERVEAVPLLGRDLLADMAGVFAGGNDGADDAGLKGGVEGEGLGKGIGVVVPDDVRWVAEGAEHATPAVLGAGGALVEHEIEVDVEETGGMLGALEIAAHPVEAVGDT